LSEIRRPAHWLAWLGDDPPIVVIIVSFALSLVWISGYVFPLDGLRWPAGDELLMVWNLWNVNESITHGHNPFVAPNVYYPVGARLGMHTYSPGLWPVAWVTQWATGNAPLYALEAYHLCLWLSFALALAFSYLFLRRVGCSRFASLVPSMAYAFSVFARVHVPHLQHISFIFFLPLVSLAVRAAFDRPQAWRLLLLAFLLGFGIYLSEMSVFLWMGLALFAALAFLRRSTRAAMKQALAAYPRWTFVAAGLLFLVVLSPFLHAWSGHEGHAPKRRQTEGGSANVAGFFFPHSSTTRLYGAAGDRLSVPVGPHGRQLPGVGGNDLFLGFPLLLFAALGLARCRHGWLSIVAWVTAGFFVLSLGPALLVGSHATGWPLPYALLMKVPPFSIGRTPARNVVFVLWGATLLAAHGFVFFERWISDRSRPAAALFGSLLLLWVALEVYVPPPAAASYTIPTDLVRLAPGAVANVPISPFDGLGVFLQTIHHRPIVTGFVSRREPRQMEHIRSIDDLLNRDPDGFVARMAELGVGTIVLGPETPPEVAQALDSQKRLSVLHLRPFENGQSSEPEGAEP
jgi:hypothetical protein